MSQAKVDPVTKEVMPTFKQNVERFRAMLDKVGGTCLCIHDVKDDTPREKYGMRYEVWQLPNGRFCRVFVSERRKHFDISYDSVAMKWTDIETELSTNATMPRNKA